MFATTFSQMLVILLLALLGWGLRKGKILSDPFLSKLNLLLVLVAQPAMMLASTQPDAASASPANFLMAAGITTAALILMMALMFLFTHRLPRKVYAVICSAASLPNFGYMGIPIAQVVLGEESIFFLSASVIGFNIAQWTMGSLLFGKAQDTGHRRNPNIILPALGLGVLLLVLNIRLPGPLLGALKQLSNLNTPLAMLILGARMEHLRISDFKDPRIWLVSFVKLIAFPLVLLAVLRPLPLPPLLVNTLVLGFAMPCAANVQIQTELKQGDTLLAARCITVTMLLSLLTIPLIMWIAG